MGGNRSSGGSIGGNGGDGGGGAKEALVLALCLDGVKRKQAMLDLTLLFR